MSNEAAFEKWAIDYGLDYEPSFTRYDVEASWQAAIAYMQEQSKEVVEAIRERDRLGFAVVNVIGKLDEIIENTQEIEIDDFLHIAVPIDMWNELQAALEDMPERADLYTSPQPRDWVSLGDDDIRDVFRKFGWTANRVDFEDARAIEAKLKQLNTKG